MLAGNWCYGPRDPDDQPGARVSARMGCRACPGGDRAQADPKTIQTMKPRTDEQDERSSSLWLLRNIAGPQLPAATFSHRSDMFDALHRLLTGLDHPHRAAEQNDSAFALAVLLIEAARSSDNRVDDREEGVIERALTRRFGLERNEVIRLVKAAEE